MHLEICSCHSYMYFNLICICKYVLKPSVSSLDGLRKKKNVQPFFVYQGLFNPIHDLEIATISIASYFFVIIPESCKFFDQSIDHLRRYQEKCQIQRKIITILTIIFTVVKSTFIENFFIYRFIRQTHSIFFLIRRFFYILSIKRDSESRSGQESLSIVKNLQM